MTYILEELVVKQDEWVCQTNEKLVIKAITRGAPVELVAMEVRQDR
jgi:hypothetical protein